MTDEALRPRRKVCVVTATRAEYGLLYWLLLALRNDPQIELQLVVTGAHLSPLHGQTVRQIEADGFEIAERLTILLQEDSPVGITKSIGLATLGFADAFSRRSPDLIVILGDRYEMLAAAQAAMIARIPIAHIHGGEATEGLIDEAIRHAITKMSHLHFVAAKEFENRVIQLGENPDRVWVVGALGLDNIEKLPIISREDLESELGIKLSNRSLLITYHPVTLFAKDQSKEFEALLEVADGIAETLLITGVNADTGAERIRETAVRFASDRGDRVVLVESLGAMKYLSAIRHVGAVCGNSSSGLIEAPSLGTPTVDIGPRQQGRLRAPSVIHCEANKYSMDQAIRKAISDDHRAEAAKKISLYGSAGASARIAAVLKTHSLDGIIVKRFHDIMGKP